MKLKFNQVYMCLLAAVTLDDCNDMGAKLPRLQQALGKKYIIEAKSGGFLVKASWLSTTTDFDKKEQFISKTICDIFDGKGVLCCQWMYQTVTAFNN